MSLQQVVKYRNLIWILQKICYDFFIAQNWEIKFLTGFQKKNFDQSFEEQNNKYSTPTSIFDMLHTYNVMPVTIFLLLFHIKSIHRSKWVKNLTWLDYVKYFFKFFKGSFTIGTNRQKPSCDIKTT